MVATAETRRCPFRGLTTVDPAMDRRTAVTEAFPWHFQICEHRDESRWVEWVLRQQLALSEFRHAAGRWCCSQSDVTEPLSFHRYLLRLLRLEVPVHGVGLKLIRLKMNEQTKYWIKHSANVFSHHRNGEKRLDLIFLHKQVAAWNKKGSICTFVEGKFFHFLTGDLLILPSSLRRSPGPWWIPT